MDLVQSAAARNEDGATLDLFVTLVQYANLMQYSRCLISRHDCQRSCKDSISKPEH